MISYFNGREPLEANKGRGRGFQVFLSYDVSIMFHLSRPISMHSQPYLKGPSNVPFEDKKNQHIGKFSFGKVAASMCAFYHRITLLTPMINHNVGSSLAQNWIFTGHPASILNLNKTSNTWEKINNRG